MKPHAQMIEGPEAFARFRDALKAVLAVPKNKIVQHEKREVKRKKSDVRHG